jgi:hypothetical protein
MRRRAEVHSRRAEYHGAGQTLRDAESIGCATRPSSVLEGAVMPPAKNSSGRVKIGRLEMENVVKVDDHGTPEFR